MRTAVVVVFAFVLTFALSGSPARAGPKEARELWDRARALRDASWREQAVAYRAVVAEANPTDRMRARALMALADVLRKADHPHGAAAAEAVAASTGPKADDGRLRVVLAHARALRSEGDVEAAAAFLDEVARLARAESPKLADQALDLRSEDAFEAGDDGALARLQAAADRDRAAAHVRVRIAGRLGERRLALGDRDGARRCLRVAEAATKGVEKREDEEALLATRAWLDLPLRRLLES